MQQSRPLPKHTKAQSWHTQSELVTNPAPHSLELWRFIAGYLALLPLKKAAVEIDKRFVKYLLELSDGVTGRIIEVLRRAALQAFADKFLECGTSAAPICGSSHAVSHRPKVVIFSFRTS
jgi:hypothetical protein